MRDAPAALRALAIYSAMMTSPEASRNRTRKLGAQSTPTAASKAALPTLRGPFMMT